MSDDVRLTAADRTADDQKAAVAALEQLGRARDNMEHMFLIAAAVCWGGLIVGALIEGYRWLQTGLWNPDDSWPVGRALLNPQWLDAPRSWLGLHRTVTAVLDWPLFVTAPLIVGALLGIAWVWVRDHYDTKLSRLAQERGVRLSDFERRRFDI